MDRLFAIDTALVVSDIIDGEAIILHRGSGTYFSTDGVGSLIWQSIGDGQSRARILEMLSERFTTPRPEMEAAADSFFAELVSHDLAREITDGGESAAQSAPKPNGAELSSMARARFVAPTLHVYQDIRKLLLLDPLHDVAEMAGWPIPKPTDPLN